MLRLGLLMMISLLLCAAPAIADNAVPAAPAVEVPAVAAPVVPAKIDTGDTSWVLISAAMVMLMTPGLAFFYGGLVRRKNYLNVLMQCMIILAVLSLQWVLFGYSLSFAPGTSWIGGLQWCGLKGVGL
ncbi:MAG: ammonia channel protein, partial [Sedimentisphaerales bacterium]|nr:ammonia channel protein [Sedimentisphaerales bacterium]